MEDSELEKRKDIFAEEFRKCRPALNAVGDETRQHLLLTLIKNSGRGGMRVGDIQKETSISRTAVSHHLKILREAHIIAMRSAGTKNYYFLDADSSSIKELAAFWEKAVTMAELCQYHNKPIGENDYENK